MPDPIPELIAGQAPTLLSAERANPIIRRLNGLMNSVGKDGVKVYFEDSGRMVITFDSESASGGGGIPSGFEEETLDIVQEDNTAGQRVFLTKEVEVPEP